jgi:putative AbiEi antitoxin of type IV toxin-antitoxin system
VALDDVLNLSVSELLTKLKADAAHERRLEREARGRAQRAEAALAALEALQPSPLATNDPLPGVDEESTPSGDAPRGEVAVLAVMRERSSELWTTGEIHAALEERAWITPDAKHPRAGVEAALSRLVKKGALVRLDRGLYGLPDGEGDTTETEA